MKAKRSILGISLLIALGSYGFGCGEVVEETDGGTAPTCSNGAKDGNETDVDCGGSCSPCAGGLACNTGSDCTSGNCPADEGICCDTPCDSTCEACTAAKTGATDGTCAPVTATTDPDSECSAQDPSTCGATGTGCNGSATAPGCNVFSAGTVCSPGQCTAGTSSAPSMCDGSGTCVSGQTTSCAPFLCDSTGTICSSSCSSNAQCASGAFCNAVSACAPTLRVALQADPGGCLHDAGEVFDRVRTLLQQRGHSATFVTGADLDTAAEIGAFDVVVLGGSGGGCSNPDTDWPVFDAQVEPYVRGGGGLVASSWTVYGGHVTNSPKIAAMLPVQTGSSYLTTPTVSPVAGHLISNGLSPFVANEYCPYGAGAKAGASVILTSGGNQVAEAWTVDAGRSVFLGPMYFEAFVNYDNEGLLDGSTPDATELMLRAIEWAGGSL